MGNRRGSHSRPAKTGDLFRQLQLRRTARGFARLGFTVGPRDEPDQQTEIAKLMTTNKKEAGRAPRHPVLDALQQIKALPPRSLTGTDIDFVAHPGRIRPKNWAEFSLDGESLAHI